MTEIIRSGACGNSPKNQRVEDLTVALATGDEPTAAELLSDDAQWQLMGGALFEGKTAVLDALAQANDVALVRLTVEQVMTHGKAGAVNGTLEDQNGAVGFCDVFEFANTKGTHIRRIKSYHVRVA